MAAAITVMLSATIRYFQCGFTALVPSGDPLRTTAGTPRRLAQWRRLLPVPYDLNPPDLQQKCWKLPLQWQVPLSFAAGERQPFAPRLARPLIFAPIIVALDYTALRST